MKPDVHLSFAESQTLRTICLLLHLNEGKIRFYEQLLKTWFETTLPSWKPPGGNSYMEQTGMLVGNFEFDP